ncbi:MAG: thiol reductase thioredoxin [Phycisphaerae bacterium]|nr:thiol reductase thioredoxin [Phycisphaerae bacterium]|tara:strand:- start:120 stop:698 length:579 start_codon:yes stop_codon:yes gene_type:complete
MMLHEAAFLEEHFKSGMEMEPFVSMLPFDQQASWVQRHGQLELNEQQMELLNSFTRDMKILCLTGPWCGDCALQGAALARIAAGQPDRIQLRFIPRDDSYAELIISSMINAGTRVPVTWIMAEDFEPCARIGDRTLSRYRSMARKALGPASGVLADPPEDPVRAVLDEMLDEVERVQWMLRLSPRLREKHGD